MVGWRKGFFRTRSLFVPPVSGLGRQASLVRSSVPLIPTWTPTYTPREREQVSAADCPGRVSGPN